MIMYYKFFHLRHLKHKFLSCDYNHDETGVKSCNNMYQGISSKNCANNISTKLPMSDMNVITGIPGVFNCRLNPALKRKKKKPTTFVPPPTSSLSVSNNSTFTSINADINPSNYQQFGDLNAAKSQTLNAVNNSSVNEDNVLSVYSPSNDSNINCSYMISGNKPRLLPPTVSSAISCNTNLNIPNMTKNVKYNRMISLVNINDQASGPGSRVNIAQKLQEKKQHQLNQLRKIEKEIKQGKLRPHEFYSPPLIPANYPPITKKQPWANCERLERARIKNNGSLPYYYYYHPAYRRMKYRSQTPEVLLVPHYLGQSRIYYDYPSCILPPKVFSRLSNQMLVRDDSSVDEDDPGYEMSKRQISVTNGIKRSSKCNFKLKKSKVSNSPSNRTVISDVESQVSLPRSYTLPREFRYYKNSKLGTMKFRNGFKNEHFQELPSNNSSDGDVDSDFNTVDETDDETVGVPKMLKSNPPLPLRTKLSRNRQRL